jgi:WD40 repeat protein
MIPFGRIPVLPLAALVLAGSLWAQPAVSEQAKAADGPGRGDLAGFVATPQTTAGGNRAFLIAPDGAWFLATSAYASVVRLIDVKTGVTLRYLTSPGLQIAALSISSDSKTAFARGSDGRVVAWDTETGAPASTTSQPAFHDIKSLTSYYNHANPDLRPTAEFLARTRLLQHFPNLTASDDIVVNPAQNYAIIGHVGDFEWKAFQVWNLKKEKTEFFFKLDDDSCHGNPIAFDYDGEHLVFGNSGGGCDPAHLDFIVYRIDGPFGGPEEHKAQPILYPRCDDAGAGQQFDISRSGNLLTRTNEMPQGDEWAAWDLRNGKKVASIRPDGAGFVSDDDKTFVVVHDLQADDSRSRQKMTVSRGGKQRTFELPQSMQTSERPSLVLSPNGKWIASQVGLVAAVWSSEDGKPLHEYKFDKPSMILRVSDAGEPTLIASGSVFTKGAWRTPPPNPDGTKGLILPLTPNFHGQCGPVFCDRVMPEFGLVERKPIDDRAQHAAPIELSRDGRFMMSGSGEAEGTDIIEIATGNVVLHVDHNQPRFSPDGRFVFVRRQDSDAFDKYDLTSGKRVWTAFPNRKRDGFAMILADGRVRLTPGPAVDLMLVRGFETRQFDAHAQKQFATPPDADESLPRTSRLHEARR